MCDQVFLRSRRYALPSSGERRGHESEPARLDHCIHFPYTARVVLGDGARRATLPRPCRSNDLLRGREPRSPRRAKPHAHAEDPTRAPEDTVLEVGVGAQGVRGGTFVNTIFATTRG